MPVRITLENKPNLHMEYGGFYYRGESFYKVGDLNPNPSTNLGGKRGGKINV